VSLLGYKILAGVLIFITSVLAVIYPIRVRARPKHNLPLELGDAFASGIFLGAALFHMLPDATQGFSAIYGAAYHYPLAEILCAGGFLLLLLLERLSQNKNLFHRATNTVPYILTLTLTIHALIEGAALGINTTVATTFIIFVAILAHKSSESFALAVILNQSTMTLKRIIIIVSVFALMTPLGIVLGAALTDGIAQTSGQLLAAIFNAFAAGTFLYMSTLHHINHHHRQHDNENLWEFIFLLLGISIMAGLAWWA
jgi:zinc transporter 1/2/3